MNENNKKEFNLDFEESLLLRARLGKLKERMRYLYKKLNELSVIASVPSWVRDIVKELRNLANRKED